MKLDVLPLRQFTQVLELRRAQLQTLILRRLGVLSDLKKQIQYCTRAMYEVFRAYNPTNTNKPIFLDYCFLHKTKPFEYQKNSDEGKYKQVQHSQYIIKSTIRHYITGQRVRD
jgi:hypothetical protein